MSPEFWQLVVTHDPLQKVVPEGQPPRRAAPGPAVGGRPCAKATPGMDANSPPRRAPPTNFRAPRLETIPLANPFAASSKECSHVLPIGVGVSLFWSSVGIYFLRLAP